MGCLLTLCVKHEPLLKLWNVLIGFGNQILDDLLKNIVIFQFKTLKCYYIKLSAVSSVKYFMLRIFIPFGYYIISKKVSRCCPRRFALIKRGVLNYQENGSQISISELIICVV